MIESDERYVGWSRPAAWRVVNVTRCRACGARVSFARSASGASSAMLDRDGSRHGATCPDPSRYALLARQRGWR